MGTSSPPPANPAPRLATEWLLADGRGGFALGTALGANTRRYHGLLIPAAAPPVRRVLALHSLIEQIETGGQTLTFAPQHFGDPPRLHPDGWTMLASFECDEGRSVRWTWTADGIEVTRTLRLSRDRAAARIDYRVRCDRGDSVFRVRPVTPMRDFHDLVTAESDPPATTLEPDGDHLRVTRAGASLNLLGANDFDVRLEPQWWRDIAYPEDRARGQDWREHLWSPGVLESRGRAGRRELRLDAVFGHDVRPTPSEQPGTDVEPIHRPGDPVRHRLTIAAGQFLVARPSDDQPGLSIIAGYPWFADWGRDAMISLPGLLLVPGRLDEARSVLETFARSRRNGLIPNRFDDRDGSPEYNTVDASLWFVHALCEYGRAMGERVSDDLLDAAREVIAAYRRGTDFGIRVDADGLVPAGDETTQLTWMDAARDGVVFTPRHGKAIEINALWHHALLCLAEMSDDDEEAAALREQAGAAALAIRIGFWWPERECLHDVLAPDGSGWAPDGKLRPNQVIAAALRHSPLTREQRRAIVIVARDHLLTPYGLRTLDREDPEYRGRYEGDLMQRDAAYHNGTVWPWLIGPFAEAILRAGDFSDAARAEARQVIQPLLAALDVGCLGQLAEVYDGDAPHRPSGCPAQAWSMAEVLRLHALVDAEGEFTA
ncbi:MAG: amylo-alpha-1,6-glucosidase [Planctomycetota bacterium]|jgi:predicted glycogen debranching enzyme